MAFRRNSVLRVCGALAALATVGVAGCGHPTADQEVNAALKSVGQTRANVLPFAGTVTIDGRVPESGMAKPRIVVMLHDPAKPGTPLSGVPKAICNPKGEFSFNTYGQGDGVPPGKYVVVIVSLRFDKRKGYVGPDGLKNLYNDPKKNAEVPQFVVDHQSPGKKDYAFALQVDNREPVTPSPNAVTAFR